MGEARGWEAHCCRVFTTSNGLVTTAASAGESAASEKCSHSLSWPCWPVRASGSSSAMTDGTWDVTHGSDALFCFNNEMCVVAQRSYD